MSYRFDNIWYLLFCLHQEQTIEYVWKNCVYDRYREISYYEWKIQIPFKRWYITKSDYDKSLISGDKQSIDLIESYIHGSIGTYILDLIPQIPMVQKFLKLKAFL